ncbi:MAG: hypothetical protein QFX35_06650 [Candidatus Verstraetearchaeota archaeon]|nr:hypothetical protein [Candidatus Verstraetearchaeota archaeon]
MMGLKEKAVYLISGGIDSPVAAYLGIMRGWEPLFVHFDNRPFIGENELEKAKLAAARLVEFTGTEAELLLIPHGRDLELILTKCRRNLSCLLCKRMMYRKADAIARAEGCGAIVTGEIIGEQASQTLHNLILNTSVAESQVVRPLLGFNKTEVEEIARRIGTYPISAMKSEGCSAASIKARTLARSHELEKEELNLPLRELVDVGLRDAKRIRLP